MENIPAAGIQSGADEHEQDCEPAKQERPGAADLPLARSLP